MHFPAPWPTPPNLPNPFDQPEFANVAPAQRQLVIDLLAGCSTSMLLERGRQNNAARDLLWTQERARAIDPARGYGFLDLKGTSAGAPDRLAKYIRYAQHHGGVFPYWRLPVAAKATIALGQPVTAVPGPGNTFAAQQPKGIVPFVIMVNGECRIGPTLRRLGVLGLPPTGVNHAFIAQMAHQVAFAGELHFGGAGVSGAAGVLQAWSNESGGYRTRSVDARRVGLPIALYLDQAGLPAVKDYVSHYGAGRSAVNYGRYGPPAIAQSKGDYWYV